MHVTSSFHTAMTYVWDVKLRLVHLISLRSMVEYRTL